MTEGTQLLDRAMMVLETVGDAGTSGATLAEVEAKLGLSASTCHRIVSALARHGMLARDGAGRRYRLGLRFFVLGAKAADASGIGTLCRPTLTRLCAETDDTAFLMARHNFDSVCIDRRDGRVIIQTLTGSIGGSAPLGIGPGSQAILAFLDAAEIEAIIRYNAARYRTIQGQSVQSVRSALNDVRSRGYAIDNDGLIQGVSGIAVPILPLGGGQVTVSLGLGMLSSQAAPRRLEQLADRLISEAAVLSDLLNPLAL